MTRSPGHQKWPEHHVIEEHPGSRFQVFFNGEMIADSQDVVKVVEDEHPERFYFPRQDVRMEALQRTSKTTQCPFKGTAHYYSLKVKDRKEDDAVWTYEEPFVEHEGLKDRLAFYAEKVDEIKILD